MNRKLKLALLLFSLSISLIITSCADSSKKNTTNIIKGKNTHIENDQLVGHWEGYLKIGDCPSDVYQGLLTEWKIEYDFGENGVVVITQYRDSGKAPLTSSGFYDIDSKHLNLYWDKSKLNRFIGGVPEVEFLTKNSVRIISKHENGDGCIVTENLSRKS